MTADTAAAVLASTSAVLLDFDGPVCSVFSAFAPAKVANELREALNLQDAPETGEPFELLTYVANSFPAASSDAEAELARLERVAVIEAQPTPGAGALLQRFHSAGRPVVIVSNNSSSAVDVYLDQHELRQFVVGVSSRISPDPALLKPHPHLLHRGAELIGVPIGDCVMIGDSTTDIAAAYAAGAAAVGYANKPGKRERFEALGVTAIVEQMSELLQFPEK